MVTTRGVPGRDAHFIPTILNPKFLSCPCLHEDTRDVGRTILQGFRRQMSNVPSKKLVTRYTPQNAKHLWTPRQWQGSFPKGIPIYTPTCYKPHYSNPQEGIPPQILKLWWLSGRGRGCRSISSGLPRFKTVVIVIVIATIVLVQ